MKPEIGLVGYGRFGQLLARHMAKRCTVCVYDRRRNLRAGPRIRFMPLDEVVQRPVVVFAVPISELQNVLTRVRRRINPTALVLDVCSVKAEPLRWMRTLLPPTVTIIGTHPLFGPSSAAPGVRGKSIVLCRGRSSRSDFAALRAVLKRNGLIVHAMTPEAHDRWMARTLFVTQYLGRGVRKVTDGEALPTAAFFHLQRLMEIASGDTPRLLLDLYRFNRFAKKIPGQIKIGLSSTLHPRHNR